MVICSRKIPTTARTTFTNWYNEGRLTATKNAYMIPMLHLQVCIQSKNVSTCWNKGIHGVVILLINQDGVDLMMPISIWGLDMAQEDLMFLCTGQAAWMLTVRPQILGGIMLRTYSVYCMPWVIGDYNESVSSSNKKIWSLTGRFGRLQRWKSFFSSCLRLI